MRHVVSIQNLEVLDILEIRYPGKLNGFSKLVDLKVFRCNHYMSEEDLIEVSKLPALRELGAQNASISRRSLEALLCMPYLKNIDLECSDFDDELAGVIGQSRKIEYLDVGASKLTSKGLKHISHMSQLKSLDIWAINI